MLEAGVENCFRHGLTLIDLLKEPEIKLAQISTDTKWEIIGILREV